MSLQLEKYLQIKYLKLHFELQFLEDSVLPYQKASALRGGMGEMLLRMNCISDRDCVNCEYENECIVRRTMYSKMAIKPAFMHEGDSVGYVIECEDHNTEYASGDSLKFNLLLFGPAIVYFSQYLQAFQLLGMNGIGKNSAKFVIKRLTNTIGEDILAEHNIYIENVRPKPISEYVSYRIPKTADAARLIFHTPLSIKYQKEMIQSFDPEAILSSIERRIYMLNCYKGTDLERITINSHVPKLQYEEIKHIDVKRYSNRHESKIKLSGICGYADFEDIDETCKELLLAGELIHIGKNTSFGFGRYSFAE